MYHKEFSDTVFVSASIWSVHVSLSIMPVFDTYTFIYSATIGLVSGVARLGHTGAHALATRGCAQLVHVYAFELSVLIVLLSIAN